MSDIPLSIRRAALEREMEITVRIGRSGVNDSVIEELRSQLEKRKLVKVKVNRGIVEGSEQRTELFNHLATVSESRLVHQRGNVAVFWLS